jgi:tetratricopeptide (TPR) repeat protein
VPADDVEAGARAPAPSPAARGLPAGALAVAWLAFLGIGLALYGPTLGGPFLSDDLLYLEGNPNLRRPLATALGRMLEPYFANWTPLHHLLLLVEWRLFGAWTTPYHVVNVALHAAAATALAAASARAGLSRVAALAAGALLLAHPAASEAVAWISQSKTLLCVSLGLLALERWIAHLQAPSRGRRAAVLAAAGLALLAKPAALPLPVILLGVAFCLRADLRRAARDLLPLLLAAPLAFALNLYAQAIGGGVAPWFGGSRLATAQVLPWVWWRYVRLSVAPVGLAHGVHPEPVTGWGDPALLVPGLALVVVAGAVAFLCLRRRERAIGPIWFVAMLAPVAQAVPMAVVYADRYLYTALPGAIWLVAQLGDEWARAGGPRAARALAATAAAAALALGAATVERARLWADPEALYRESADAFPLGRFAWTGVGSVLDRRGELAGAAAAYRHSLYAYPDDPQVRYLLGEVRRRQGDLGRALYGFEEALRLAPEHFAADRTAIEARVRRLRARGVRPVPDPPEAPPGLRRPPAPAG